jgi:diguanylate cyclase (GGDEF)-like protein
MNLTVLVVVAIMMVLGGAFAGAWLLVRRISALHAVDRLARLTAQTKALGFGPAPSFEPEAAKDALGELERSVATLTVQLAMREARIAAQTSAHQLDRQVQRALGMADTEAGVLDVASRAFAVAAPSSALELLLSDETESEIHLAAFGASGPPGCPAATSMDCAAMRAGYTLRFDDPKGLDVCPHLRNRPGGPKRAACIPLAPTRGTTGVLHVTSEDDTLNDDTVERLELVAGHVGSRLRMLHVLQVFQSQAQTDALTGLVNRRSFEERVAVILRAKPNVTIAILDLDHFKKLNDTHGHAVGDDALRVFARVARSFAAAHSGLAARLGGEEFVIQLPGGHGASHATIFEELRASLRAAVTSSACPEFTVSIGVAAFPDHGSNLSELLLAADRALYQAKSRGRDCVVTYGSAELVATAVPTARSSVRPLAREPGLLRPTKLRDVA